MKKVEVKRRVAIIITGSMLATTAIGCGNTQQQEYNETVVSSEVEETEIQSIEAETVGKISENTENTENLETSESEAEEQSDVSTEESSIENVEATLDKAKEFSYELFKNSMEQANAVISPISAYIAMSMIESGAQESTLEQFNNTMGENAVSISSEIMNEMEQLNGNINLSIANSVWIDDQFKVNKSWTKELKGSLDAEIMNTDLQDIVSVELINNWVDNKTHGMIDRVLNQPFTDDAMLALVNTVYFKGTWQSEFNEADTTQEEFKLEDDESAIVQMMHKSDYTEYICNEFADGVVLDYIDNTFKYDSDGYAYRTTDLCNKLQLVLIKPLDEDENIRDFYTRLNNNIVDKLLNTSDMMDIKLSLPRFTADVDTSLVKPLQDMGLTYCFNGNEADLSSISEPVEDMQNLYVSSVTQKAKVELDETGTEASAATVVVVANDMLTVDQDEDYKEVKFDRPFVYIIMDNDNHIPLFIGIMDNPLLSGNI